MIFLPNIVQVENAKSKSAADAFADAWSNCYPSPTRCLHDNGNGYLGPSFTMIQQKKKIKVVPTTIKSHKQMRSWKENISQIAQ